MLKVGKKEQRQREQEEARSDLFSKNLKEKEKEREREKPKSKVETDRYSLCSWDVESQGMSFLEAQEQVWERKFQRKLLIVMKRKEILE